MAPHRVLRALRYCLATLDEAQKEHPSWVYSDAQATLREAITQIPQQVGVPTATVRTECNTFEFFVKTKDFAKEVTTNVFTTFEGGSLEEDFPNGSSTAFVHLRPRH